MTRLRSAFAKTSLAAALGALTPACHGTLDTGDTANVGLEEGGAAHGEKAGFEVHEKIVGGHAESGYPAVGALLTSDGGICTGTVIAQRWVVTAAHCLEGGVSGATFSFGPNVDDPTKTIRVTSGSIYPRFDPDEIVNDIALVHLASNAGVEPVALVPSLEGQVGAPLTFVGYGITSSSREDSGVKRSVVIPLARLDETTFQYGTRGKQTCSGDSGGPAFLTVNGVVTIAGVTSYGDPGCRQYGVDTRIDTYASWIRSVIGDQPAPSPQPAPPSPDHEPVDPCGGLTYEGQCVGAVARWCEDGKIKENDCARAGQGCGFVDPQTGYYCTAASPQPAPQAPEQEPPPPVAPPQPVPEGDGCGGLDYLGQCSGRVARWCVDGRISERDCAGFGQRCGFVNNQVGYYCR